MQKQTKRVTLNGETKKETPIKKNGGIHKNIAESKWGKLSGIEFLKNGYKDAQGTQGQLQETEWELQQHEKGNRIYEQELGRNEEYNI